MTRKTASRIEKELKAMGVYKPYVTAIEAPGGMCIDSYPLEVRIGEGFNTTDGPFSVLALHDCTRPRIGEESLVETQRVLMGGPVLARAADMLKAHHTEAYARAKEQERACMADLAGRLAARGLNIS